MLFIFNSLNVLEHADVCNACHLCFNFNIVIPSCWATSSYGCSSNTNNTTVMECNYSLFFYASSTNGDPNCYPFIFLVLLSMGGFQLFHRLSRRALSANSTSCRRPYSVSVGSSKLPIPGVQNILLVSSAKGGVGLFATHNCIWQPSPGHVRQILRGSQSRCGIEACFAAGITRYWFIGRWCLWSIRANNDEPRGNETGCGPPKPHDSLDQSRNQMHVIGFSDWWRGRSCLAWSDGNVCDPRFITKGEWIASLRCWSQFTVQSSGSLHTRSKGCTQIIIIIQNTFRLVGCLGIASHIDRGYAAGDGRRAALPVSKHTDQWGPHCDHSSVGCSFRHSPWHDDAEEDESAFCL